MATRILGINGSIRLHSSADRALRFVLRSLEVRGAVCETFDIGSLPLLDGRPDDEYPASVEAWRVACYKADAIVIAAPSYHGALPGSLKNALDFIDVPQVGGKPFAVVGISAGDAEPVVTDVARVMRHVGGIAAVLDIVVSHAPDQWGKGDEPASPILASQVEHMVEALIDLCKLRAAGELPHAWRH